MVSSGCIAPVVVEDMRARICELQETVSQLEHQLLLQMNPLVKKDGSKHSGNKDDEDLFPYLCLGAAWGLIGCCVIFAFCTLIRY